MSRRPMGCGGYASSSGHCGAPDCPTCYPSSWQDEALVSQCEECSDEACPISPSFCGEPVSLARHQERDLREACAKAKTEDAEPGYDEYDYEPRKHRDDYF